MIDGSSAPANPETLAKKKTAAERRVNSRQKERGTGFLGKIQNFFRQPEKSAPSGDLDDLLKQLKINPDNTKARLKVAELYQRKGQKEKSILEYLHVADTFSRKGFYPQAMAIYKQILRQNPVLDEASFRVADIYRRMGFLGDALAQYNHLLDQYNRLGLKEKTQEILGLIKEIDLRTANVPNEPIAGVDIAQDLPSVGSTPETGSEPKNTEGFFDLGAELEAPTAPQVGGTQEVSTEKFSGFGEILSELKESGAPSKVYPDFNYRMGMACYEMGFLDEAVEQFQNALARGQAPFESARALGVCYKEKNWWQEACLSFDQALKVPGISPEQRMNVEKELQFVSQEQKKMEQTFECGGSKNPDRARHAGNEKLAPSD